MAYFPGVGAFEQLFIQMPGSLPRGGGMLKFRFDWYIMTTTCMIISKLKIKIVTHHIIQILTMDNTEGRV